MLDYVHQMCSQIALDQEPSCQASLHVKAGEWILHIAKAAKKLCIDLDPSQKSAI